MRIAALFHVSFEKLGYIEDWIIRTGHSLTEYHLYDNPRLPQTGEFDLLIIMGGSMSVHDEATIPWLKPEKMLIGECIGSGKAIIGICLGAQLIASALGNRVFQGKYKEIGWFPVELNRNEELKAILPGLPEMLSAFHWHGETFDLPAGSMALASSAVTPCQGFLFRRNILALQFHLEVKPENISLMINHAGKELAGGPYIQDAGTIAAGLEHTTENKRIMEIFLTYFEHLINPHPRHVNH